MDNKESLDAGKRKLHSSMWGQCTQMIKNKLESATDCATMHDNKDPIALIKIVKGATHNFKDQKCAMCSVWQTHKQLFSCAQREDENIKDHFDHFKNHVDVMENGGDKLGTEKESLQWDKTFNKLPKL